MLPGAKAVVEVVANLGADLELKAEHAAKAGGGAKAVLVRRVEQEVKAGSEVKAGLTIGAGVEVGVIAEARRRVIYGARAESGGPSHEVAVLKRDIAKTKKERGAPAAAAVLAVVTV